MAMVDRFGAQPKWMIERSNRAAPDLDCYLLQRNLARVLEMIAIVGSRFVTFFQVAPIGPGSIAMGMRIENSWRDDCRVCGVSVIMKCALIPGATHQDGSYLAEMVAEDLKDAQRDALAKAHGYDLPVAIETKAGYLACSKSIKVQNFKGDPICFL